METLVLVVHVLVAVFLVGAILLQSGKGADIGAAFGAVSSGTVFGPRGAATLLHKVTVVAASLFLITSISLTYFSRRDAGSVLDAIPAPDSPIQLQEQEAKEKSEETLQPAPEEGKVID